MDSEIWIFTILMMVFMAVMFIAPTALIVWLVVWLKKNGAKNNGNTATYAHSNSYSHCGNASVGDKKVKCFFCDAENPYEAVVCVKCGSVLNKDDSYIA